MVRTSLSALAFAVLLPASVRADVPPDPDSADAHCSKAQQCPTGELCPYAFRPGEPDGESQAVGAACRDEMAAKKYEERCRSGSLYNGERLYCPPGATGSWTPPGQKPAPAPTPVIVDTRVAPASEPASAPPPAKAANCSLVAGGDAFGLLALLGLLVLRRRR